MAVSEARLAHKKEIFIEPFLLPFLLNFRGLFTMPGRHHLQEVSLQSSSILRTEDFRGGR